MRKWMVQFSQVFRRPGRRVAKPVSFRPTLEALEERRLLTTYTVSNTLSSGTGSLAQAITNANAHAGLDEIDFSIGTGAVKIDQRGSLPTITQPVYINGTSQPGFTNDPLVEINGVGLEITGGGTTVRGLVINNVQYGSAIDIEGGSGNVIAGDYLGTSLGGTVAKGNIYGVFIQGSSDNTIGGVDAADRNLISGNITGIVLVGATTTGNVIEGNFIGTNRAGTGALGNENAGVILEYGAGNNIVGGSTSAARNVISGNEGPGIWLLATDPNDIIDGNYIGTDKTGTAALGNAATVINYDGVNMDAGILVQASNTTIGQDDAPRNVISGNLGHGVAIVEGGQDDYVFHNDIGTAKDGVTALGNGGNGVLLLDASEIEITSNTIGFNGDDGVYVQSGTRDRIRYNSIFSNGGLGIDLNAENGANNSQSFPTFTATDSGGETIVSGSLSSGDNQTYSLQFFFSTVADPSGYGEGQTYAGTTISVTTNGSGFVSFSQALGVLVPKGEFVTATATDVHSNTSEFSLAVAVQ